ncbi:ABH_G0027250.mRNA.1.CDS.1 [Saccharomyces cerevisiae]|nr:ABH_G0027250.mRNA.1.CDS.1 [Saccharomyces cerevisiae]CAI6593666.1 ABH_G0027250.mRNA.1.CDS.1 [Saccharomyces cerevisiae]
MSTIEGSNKILVEGTASRCTWVDRNKHDPMRFRRILLSWDFDHKPGHSYLVTQKPSLANADSASRTSGRPRSKFQFL